MAENFLSKIRVAPGDFVEAGGRRVLEQHAALRALLTDRTGPEVAALFAEPLISHGNDAAPPTVAWYTQAEGPSRPLAALAPRERDAAERYLADHLRPLRGLAADPSTSGLALGALSLYGQDDILVVGGRPVIVNWGLMPGGAGANAAARPGHYAATLGRYLPLDQGGEAGPAPAGAETPASGGAGAAPGRDASFGAAAGGGAGSAQDGQARALPLVAWLPLLLLTLVAALVLTWLLMPGTRLFHKGDAPPALSDRDLLAATLAQNEALRARQAQLQAALDGAQCRADGELILPGGLTPQGLVPPPLGTAPEQEADAAPDALLPTRPGRVLVPDPAEAEAQTSLLALIEARTVLVLAAGGGAAASGSGFVIGPGLVVTARHVIESAEGADGRILVAGASMGTPAPARLVKSVGPLEKAGADFALLDVEGADLPAFTIYRPEDPLALTNVVAAGYPGDVLELDDGFARLTAGDPGALPRLTVTDGIVNSEQSLGPGTPVLMHSAPLSQGNSGGPLVDMCGRLVGINAFVRQGRLQNRGFALSSGALLDFLAGTAAAPEVTSEPCTPRVLRPEVAAVPAPGAAVQE